MALSSCGGAGASDTTGDSTDITDDSSAINGTELITDSSFETGFKLKSTSTSDVYIARYLDYDGAAIETEDDIWYMAQWWTPYDFSDAEYTYRDGWHVYENESRTLMVDTEDSALTMQLDSWKEYQERFGTSRSSSSQTWSHFLLEQYFEEQQMLSGLKSLTLSFEFEISEVTMYDVANYDSTIHAAQFVMYLTIRNTKYSNYFWFGIPLYDNRGGNDGASYQVDSGFEGATGSLIYSMGQSSYLPGGATVGQHHSISVDILSYIQDGYVYGSTQTTNPPLTGWDWENCYVNYMNIGWELPGSFDVTSTLYNLSLVAEEY